MIHFDGVFFELFITCTLYLIVWFELIFRYLRSEMIMYLNVSINYLSNINCKFVMRFGYHYFRLI